jgi:hypothetical protein
MELLNYVTSAQAVREGRRIKPLQGKLGDAKVLLQKRASAFATANAKNR